MVRRCLAACVLAAALAPAASRLGGWNRRLDDCDDSWSPVCGTDGRTYCSACVAEAQEVGIVHQGMCADDLLKTAPRECGPEAERRSLPEARRFAKEGFQFSHVESKFLRGMMQLADALRSAGLPYLPKIPEPVTKPDPDNASAVRVTMEGFYYTKLYDPSAALAVPKSTETDNRHLGDAEGLEVAVEVDDAAEAAPDDGRNLIIFGRDDRAKIKGTTMSFPRRAIGQIDMDSGAVCTGTVISRDSILTAAHCVHGGKGKGAFNRLDFSPGRYRDTAGKVINPFGTWQFAYFTVFNGWVEATDFNFDMAVVTYKKNAKGQMLGDVTGFMGMVNTCTLPAIRTSGYPGDLPYGTPIITPTCPKVELRGPCGTGIAQTNCDAFAGQSGSPCYNSLNKIYATVSFATGAATSRPDTDYPSSINGLNVLNASKYASIYQWAFHK